jgi:transposase InsO family protein
LASEKIEIVRLIEQSHLSVRETLAKIGIPRATFYRWYDLYQMADPWPWRIASLSPSASAEDRNMTHVRGSPRHPMMRGKIGRWHRTLRNCMLLENHFLPGDLEVQITAFAAHYNHRHYPESLSNLTPVDVHFERGEAILVNREMIDRRIIQIRRMQHQMQAAQSECAKISLSSGRRLAQNL